MYARKNLVKEKVARGEMVIGMEHWFKDPRIIELLGHAGFDYAHIECEHIGRDWNNVEESIRAAELCNLTPLYRTEQCYDNQPPVNEITKALKLGAQIIMVPQVKNAETARKIVNAAKFPPAGDRGIATCDRSAKTIFPSPSVPLNTQKYVKELNDEIMLWAIIESVEGIKNIDEILAVEGIDAVGFGHQDYAVSAGLEADSGTIIDECREKVREAAKRSGKLMWWNTRDPAIVAEQRAKGIQIFLYSCDIIHVNNVFHNIIKECKG